jgi:transposase
VVRLFDQGWAYRSVATQLGVSPWAVRMLYRRWSVHGAGALVERRTRAKHSFELKLAVVQKHLSGEGSCGELAREFDLSSDQLVRSWVRAYRREGEAGLRPKPKGRPTRDRPAVPREVSELERLQQENRRLQAENAYLKKLRALRAQGRQ